MCLERDQFLNDAIIDFYLKHMIHQMPEEQRAKVQVFSTFFYTRLTTKPARNLRCVFFRIGLQNNSIKYNLVTNNKHISCIKRFIVAVF